jgi:uncharacterized protein YjiS (DUF1127 family)
MPQQAAAHDTMFPIESNSHSHVVCAMNSDPLNLIPISSRLAAESRPSFAACAAVTTPQLSSFRADAADWLRAQAQQLMAAVTAWRARYTQRVTLAQLDPWILRDLGLSDAELWRELRKLPWQP